MADVCPRVQLLDFDPLDQNSLPEVRFICETYSELSKFGFVVALCLFILPDSDSRRFGPVFDNMVVANSFQMRCC